MLLFLLDVLISFVCMPVTQKHTNKSVFAKVRKAKKLPKIVVVTQSLVPAKDTLFPQKLNKVDNLLSKTIFIP